MGGFDHVYLFCVADPRRGHGVWEPGGQGMYVMNTWSAFHTLWQRAGCRICTLILYMITYPPKPKHTSAESTALRKI